jgi:enamine deaminase RidA (YjgF/YER057c/UK114 family)
MRHFLTKYATLAVFFIPVLSNAAESISRLPLVGSNFPISAVVTVPAGSDLIFLSGATPPVNDPTAAPGTVAAYGNTEVQTVNVLKSLAASLERVNLKLSDVVQMRVFLVGDPDKGNKMDFAGLQAGYTKFFGTPDQPNLPVRTTVQVAGLAAPGLLVEIDVVAAKPH